MKIEYEIKGNKWWQPYLVTAPCILNFVAYLFFLGFFSEDLCFSHTNTSFSGVRFLTKLRNRYLDELRKQKINGKHWPLGMQWSGNSKNPKSNLRDLDFPRKVLVQHTPISLCSSKVCVWSKFRDLFLLGWMVFQIRTIEPNFRAVSTWLDANVR